MDPDYPGIQGYPDIQGYQGIHGYQGTQDFFLARTLNLGKLQSRLKSARVDSFSTLSFQSAKHIGQSLTAYLWKLDGVREGFQKKLDQETWLYAGPIGLTL